MKSGSADAWLHVVKKSAINLSLFTLAVSWTFESITGDSSALVSQFSLTFDIVRQEVVAGSCWSWSFGIWGCWFPYWWFGFHSGFRCRPRRQWNLRLLHFVHIFCFGNLWIFVAQVVPTPPSEAGGTLGAGATMLVRCLSNPVTFWGIVAHKINSILPDFSPHVHLRTHMNSTAHATCGCPD